jgi:putative component of membrane protein insertase Oxa1/YidC/SpoIIIJ protein YidD
LSVELVLRRGAVAAITGYQRHLSRRKGYACAYRVLTGGPSCSEHVKQLIRDEGLWPGLRRARDHFALCGEAARVLAIRRGESTGPGAATRRELRKKSAKRRRRGRSQDFTRNCRWATPGCFLDSHLEDPPTTRYLLNNLFKVFIVALIIGATTRGCEADGAFRGCGMHP